MFVWQVRGKGAHYEASLATILPEPEGIVVHANTTAFHRRRVVSIRRDRQPSWPPRFHAHRHQRCKRLQVVNHSSIAEAPTRFLRQSSYCRSPKACNAVGGRNSAKHGVQLHAGVLSTPRSLVCRDGHLQPRLPPCSGQARELRTTPHKCGPNKVDCPPWRRSRLVRSVW